MNIFTLVRNQFSASFLALVTIASLLLSALPAAFFIAEAANTDAVGTITVELMPNPGPSNPEYFTVTFDGTGTLNLAGWTVSETVVSPGVVYTFGATSLANGQSYKVCGNNSSGNGCDDMVDAGGNAIWNNDGDTLVLKDDANNTVVSVSYTTTTQGVLVTNSAAVDFLPLPPPPVIPPAPVVPTCNTSDTVADTTFDTFDLGNVHGQNNWNSSGPFDREIVENTYGYTSFGCKSLRVSNAVTSGSFGDQTFAAPIADSVGEVDATVGTFNEGTRYNRFEVEFDIASTKPSEQQTGLELSVSPDRGDGSRMSHLGFSDVAGGIQVVFFDVQGTTPGTFTSTNLGVLDRTVPHTIKFLMDMKDGPDNDVVQIFINGSLTHTGGSWENYYRNNPEAVAEQSPRLMKSLLIRTAGTAAPANDGFGFLFDNMSLEASYTPVPVVDTIKPTGVINSPENNSVVGSNFVVSGTAMDAETGIDKVLYRVNKINALGGSFVANGVSGTASGTENWSFDVTGLSEGFYRLRAEIHDNAGNIRFLTHDVEVDLTKPDVTITSPTNGQTLNNIDFTVNGTANDDKTDIAEVLFTVTNITSIGGTYLSTIATGTANGTENWSFDVQSLDNGFYRLKVQAFDEVGNWRYKHVDIVVDGDKPSLTIINPTNGSVLPTGSFTVNGTSSDTEGPIAEVTYRVNEIDAIGGSFVKNVASGVANGTENWSYNVEGLANGFYRVRAQAFDSNGNWRHQYHDIEIREIEASLNITAPATDGAVVSGVGLFTAEYIDDDLTVDSFQWAIRVGTCERGQGTIAGNVDGFSNSFTFEGSTFTANFDATELQDGEYCFVVNPREQSGEQDLRATRTFVIETPLLACEITSDTNSLIIENNEYAVETYKHRNWTALILGAKWIWETFYVEDPSETTVLTFTESFTVTGIDTATLDVAADNGYRLFVNEQLVVDRRSNENNFQTHTQKSFDVASYLVDGENTFEIEVTNKGVNSATALQNPAGVLYKLVINAETACEITTEPVPGVAPGDGDTEGPGDGEPQPPTEEPPVVTPPTEVPVAENGNNGGSNTSGTFVASRLSAAEPQQLVLGAATSQCGMLITDYLRMGIDNDPAQVKWLQIFLFGQGYFDVTINGVFDEATDTAVRAFQEQYRADILDPWVTAGILTISNPSGWVYQLTRYKINNIICPGSEAMPSLI